MPYCDGSAFTSQNFSEKVSAMGLHYKGFANMKSTIDILESRFGYSNAARSCCLRRKRWGTFYILTC